MSVFHEEFTKKSLELEDLMPDPRIQFLYWLDEYIELVANESIAMSFSTITKDGFPSSRIVYLRDYDLKGYVFFTNYNSNKGDELKENNKASILFYWPELERQVRIWGKVEKVDDATSDAYFKDRPKGSQAGAWISKQSKEIDTREKLEKAHKVFLQNVENKIISRPGFWGGYRLIPMKYEFWQGRANRLHDRFLYEKYHDNWSIKRLAP